MKRTLILLVCLFPAALIAQQVSVNATLAASPSGSANVGTPITLTATAVAGKPGPEFNITRPMQENWKYTFTATRTWPCAETTTIANKVATKSVTWSPKAGLYNLAVTAEFGITVPLGGTAKVPSGKGSASLNNYTVKPTANWSSYVASSFSPPSNTAVGPVTVGLTLSLNNAPSNKWWRYTAYGLGPAQTKDHQGASVYFTFNLNPGTYTPSFTVDQVSASADCTWEASISTHPSDYYYVVKSQ
ncbi:MAG TPA: hypothetical protein VER58_04205 [Thermoanaerobaculia bacterium]|nr:hypothetical protein [Thermoanaerobaculia bacterium]